MHCNVGTYYILHYFSLDPISPPLCVDTDVIIWEGDPSDPNRKPPEMYTLVENFCLGTRRLEIFGRARSSLRRGWVTALIDGDEQRVNVDEMAADAEGGDGAIKWEKESWEAGIRELAGMDTSGSGMSVKAVVPITPEIDALRPKSPVRGGSSNHNQGGMGMSGGVGMGGGGGVSGGVGVGMGMGMGRGRGGGFNSGPNNNAMGQNHQLMVSPMMGMGMPMNTMVGPGGMDGMGGAWPGMGMGMGVGMLGNPMGIMGMQNMQGMQGMAMGSPQGGFGMAVGWDAQGHGHGHNQMDGMWEGGMGDGMMAMGNMGNLGMGGGMGQWGQPGYEGY